MDFVLLNGLTYHTSPSQPFIVSLVHYCGHLFLYMWGCQVVWLTVTTATSSTFWYTGCSNTVPLPPFKEISASKCTLGLILYLWCLDDLFIPHCGCSNGASKVCFRLMGCHIYFLSEIWMRSTYSFPSGLSHKTRSLSTLTLYGVSLPSWWLMSSSMVSILKWHRHVEWGYSGTKISQIPFLSSYNGWCWRQYSKL